MTAEPVEQITIAKLTRIERRTPKPVPTPIVHTHVISANHITPKVISPAKPSQNEHVRRIASAAAIAHTRYHLRPVQHIPTGGHGAGASKAKALTGGIGPGGNGTGQSGTGNGTGGTAVGQEPCGYVEFMPTDDPTPGPSGQVTQHISMTVHFADRTTQTVDLDYTWTFASESTDPFLPENKNLPDPVFQFPPDAIRAQEPPVVQYVMQHTDSQGKTLLKDCPQ